MTSEFREPALWITVTRTQSEGRACRDYVVHDSSGSPLLVARAFPWRRDLIVRRPDQPDKAFILLRRRRSFPFTGNVDVIHVATEARVGTLNRNGRVRDGTGVVLGRFVDARSARRRAAESVVQAIGTAIVGGDAISGSSPDGYTYVLGARVLGALMRAPLPFDTEPASPPSPMVARVARFLPSKLGAAIQGRRTHGWRFDRAALPAGEDPRLSLVAALFTVELSQW
jgi:hypothetical protein